FAARETAAPRRQGWPHTHIIQPAGAPHAVGSAGVAAAPVLRQHRQEALAQAAVLISVRQADRLWPAAMALRYPRLLRPEPVEYLPDATCGAMRPGQAHPVRQIFLPPDAPPSSAYACHWCWVATHLCCQAHHLHPARALPSSGACVSTEPERLPL